VRWALLACFQKIIAINDIQCQYLLEKGLISILSTFFVLPNQEIKTEALSIMKMVTLKGHLWVIS
jgi:hypothetical protein